ncbi:MAG TPA: alanine racemase [Chloroflexia bacterium]|nr:alanine racemase [Chloroflexia bacterium]
MNGEVGWPGRPAWVEVDLDAIAENTRQVATWVGPTTAVMAVVKADGYGLGAVPVAAAALAGGATWLAVAAVDEGVLLRAAGLRGPILVLGPATAPELPRAVQARLTLTLSNLTGAQALTAVAGAAGLQAPVHLKVDTGLHRFGRTPDEVQTLADAIAALPGLFLEGLYTHFANAEDAQDSYGSTQLERLLQTRARLADRRIHFPVVHAASSAATLALPASHLDMVRIGIVLSGHYPAPDLGSPVRLQPAVTVRGRIARLFPLAAGATVGYGRTYRAPSARTIALLPIGYADGYHRALSNQAVVLVDGCSAPVVGRVSMDQITVDVTGCSGAQEGTLVTIAGGQSASPVSFDSLAALAGTISYELLTHLGKRLPRLYLRGGAVVAHHSLLETMGIALLVTAPVASAARPPRPPTQAWLDTLPIPGG